LKAFVRIVLNYLPAAGLLAVLYYLFRIDFTFDFNDYRWEILIVSFFALGLYYYLIGYSWFIFLRDNQMVVSRSLALASQFKTVLTKYIPGKVWMVVSASSYISERSNLSLKKLTVLFLLFLVINVFSGLLLGAAGMLLYLRTKVFFGFSVLSIIILTAAIAFLAGKLRFQGIYLLQKLPKRWKELLESKGSASLRVILLCMLQWLVLGFSFYLLILGMGFTVNLSPIFLQPLANNIGIIVPVSPGGIGVRESVMSLYLVLNGIDVHHSATIAIVSRIWFVCMELVIFLAGMVIQSKITKEVEIAV
jgi:uncharacterized membrane protein YbhN (UPF0104 family)